MGIDRVLPKSPSGRLCNAGTCDTQHLLTSLTHAEHQTDPFDHWLIDDVLPDRIIDSIIALPFPPPSDPVFDGRRESNNSARIYFTPDNQERFQVCGDVVDIFGHPSVIRTLEGMTGVNLSSGYLRIEYCQDVDGFWLEPHLDIPVKLFTMLVYLSDDPDLFDAGTDIYDDNPDHALVGSIPYFRNTGLIFVPGENTWHGFSKRPIHGLRQSIIINYVTPEWRNKEELAYR